MLSARKRFELKGAEVIFAKMGDDGADVSAIADEYEAKVRSILGEGEQADNVIEERFEKFLSAIEAQERKANADV